MSNIVLHLHHAEKLEKMLIESNGEITPEIQQEMSVNPETISNLIDTKYIGIERLEMSAAYFEKKENEFKSIRLSLENAQKFILSSIKDYMIESGKTELIGGEYQFKLSSAAPKVNVVNEDKVPEVYKNVKTEISIDKKKIGDDLKKGFPVEGCVLEENYSLRKSIIKGAK